MLDLGCGYGWHAFYAAENGAEKVLGIDLSEKMLAVAREKNTFQNVRFARGAMEDVRFPDGSFDAVLSSLALHYVKDYAELVSRVYRWLAPGGAFVFSAEHPTFTAYGNQDWYYSPEGEILHFPVDRYFYEGEREGGFPRREGYQVPPDGGRLLKTPLAGRLYGRGPLGTPAAGRDDGPSPA